MAHSPAADVTITEQLVRTLLRDSGIDSAEEPLLLASTGWDNEMWRLGTTRAIRLPRRELAVPLIAHEQAILPRVARLLQSTGVLVPEPLAAMPATEPFARPWSVVPWFAGCAAINQPRAERTAWAAQLAGALAALHVAADADAPENPVRGKALRTRDEAMRQRFAAAALPRAVTSAWDTALAAPEWSAPAVWVHGDLHPGNIVVDGDRVVALVDFGDVTAGDPAYDLAAAWLVFDSAGRAEFIAALPKVDAATWTRARGWAAAIAGTLSAHSDDRPDYAALASEIVTEIVEDRQL